MRHVWYSEPFSLYVIVQTGMYLYLRRSQVQSLRRDGFKLKLISRAFQRVL